MHNNGLCTTSLRHIPIRIGLTFMNKILTISIASYNAEKDIPRCLDSFIRSSVLNKLDIIVVNDGSSDNTYKIASEYAKNYPNSIRVIDKENGGHGSTINAGISYAKGKYFKIVDSDDWVDEDSIEKLVNYLENSNVDLVYNPFHTVNYSDHKILELIDDKPDYIPYHKIIDVKDLKGIESLHMHSMTFKTDLIKKVGPIIDEHCFYVDMEYCIYPLTYINSIVYLEAPVYEYLLGSSTQSVSTISFIKRRNEHKRVVQSLISYYQEKCSNADEKIKKLILRRINQAVIMQLIIYIKMKSSEGKSELFDFIELLKKDNFVLDFSVGSLFSRIFWQSFGFTKFKMYGLFSFVYNVLKN